MPGIGIGIGIPFRRNLGKIRHTYVKEDAARYIFSESFFNNGIVYASPLGLDSNDGLTVETPKKTISAAITIVQSGGVIQLLDGTYDMGEEAGGYLLNNSAKSFKIIGNLINPSSVILEQNNTAVAAIRYRNSGNAELAYLKITATSNAPLIYHDANYAIFNFHFNNVIFEHSGTGDAARWYRIAGGNVSDLVERHICFNECQFISSNFSVVNATMLSNVGVNTHFLFNACNFEANSSAIFYAKSKANLYAYNNSILIEGNRVAIQCGEDTAIPSYNVGNIDLRSNDIRYSSGHCSHGILLGRGTQKVYCINNIIKIEETTDDAAIGIVVKTIAEEVGESIINGNYIEAPRTLYVKGGAKNSIQYNSLVNNYVNGFGLEIANPLEEIQLYSTENIFTQNNVISKMSSIRMYGSTVKASMLSWTIDNNNFYDKNYYYVNDNSAITAWVDKSLFWDKDANSSLISIVRLPIYI